MEVRTCRACGKDLEISQGVKYQIKLGRARGEFHAKCYYGYLRREGRPARRAADAEVVHGARDQAKTTGE